MRLEAIRKGGYYPCPPELFSSIASLVRLQADKLHYVCDPCAGAGEAIDGLCKQWLSDVRGLNGTKVIPLTCELEENRYKLLMERMGSPTSPNYSTASKTNLHGDAFQVGWKSSFEGVSVLWLNPPYSEANDNYVIERKNGKRESARRWEEEFLRHYTPILADGGVLLFFVPYHALKASADTLAQNYEHITCYKTPEPLFTDYFQQVVLVAKKRPELYNPDPLWKAQIEEWASDPNGIPVLPVKGVVEPIEVSSDESAAWVNVERIGWKVLPFDVRAVLRSCKLWHAPTRSGELHPIETVLPRESFSQLFARKYPLAMPPRPTHIGAAISAGVMGGVRLTPNNTDESRDLPVLYIGGHFEKSFKAVEERTNSKGEVTGILQIEQPILKITVLDTRNASYITLKNEVAESDAKEIAEFTAGDLLKHYGDSMVAELKKRCQPLYDPSNPNEDMYSIEWPEGRIPMEAQEHSIRALVKLLQQEPDKSAIFIGSVGTGKSNVSLMTSRVVFDTSKRIGADHVLVMCPPHLGSTWKTQVEASYPGARAIMLETTLDMDDFVAHEVGKTFVSGRPSGSKLDGHSGPVVGVLSRETAKLGHRHVGIANGAWKGERASAMLKDQPQLKETGYCPRCGVQSYSDPDDLAKRRAKCSNIRRLPSNLWADFLRRIAIAIVPACPESAEVQEKLIGRGEQLYLARRRVVRAERLAAKQPTSTTEEKLAMHDRLGSILYDMAPHMTQYVHFYSRKKEANPMRGFLAMMCACGDDDAKYDAIFAFFDHAMKTMTESGRREPYNLARKMCSLIKDDALYAEAKAELTKYESQVQFGYNGWNEDWPSHARLWTPSAKKQKEENDYESAIHIGPLQIDFNDAREPVIEGLRLTSLSIAERAMRDFSGIATYLVDSEKCGEPLYQAYARPLGKSKAKLEEEECDKAAPRRIPLAYYFSKRLRKHLKRGRWMLITDEVHELSNNEDSAQSKAAQQLWNLKIPTIAMTGSIMNGYPSSLFILLWSMSSAFRSEFARHEGPLYAKTYGYQKQLISFDDKGNSKVKEFGAFSDRQNDASAKGKNAGFAPGMLPASSLKHVLRRAVTLQLRDVAQSLPQCHYQVQRVDPEEEQGRLASELMSKLHEQIKKDRFTEDSGKLMGALTEAPSFLDRCIDGVGNQENGTWVSQYPDERVVWSFNGFDTSTRLPKEKWLTDYLDNQLVAGRDVIVLVWHLNLLDRLNKVIKKDLHINAPILYSEKVAPKNREAWIQKELDNKGARVFLVNPVSISTGLNALTRFSSIVWFEPVTNAYFFRQANGRIVRIGQKREQEITSLVYGSKDARSKANAQVLMNRLLMHKVGVSEGIEGLDPAAALQAAGVGDQDMLAGRDIGRLLSSMLDGDDGALRILRREFIDRVVNQVAPDMKNADPNSDQKLLMTHAVADAMAFAGIIG